MSCSLLQLLSSNLPAAIGSHSCDEYQRRLTIVAAQKDYTIQQKGSRHVEVSANTHLLDSAPIWLGLFFITGKPIAVVVGGPTTFDKSVFWLVIHGIFGFGILFMSVEKLYYIWFHQKIVILWSYHRKSDRRTKVTDWTPQNHLSFSFIILYYTFSHFNEQKAIHAQLVTSIFMIGNGLQHW